LIFILKKTTFFIKKKFSTKTLIPSEQKIGNKSAKKERKKTFAPMPPFTPFLRLYK